FTLNFKTGPEDFTAPQVVDVYPVNTRRSEIWPIVSITFDEQVNAESIGDDAITLKQSDYFVPGEITHTVVNDQSVFHFFPSERLAPSSSYTITIASGLIDLNENAIDSDITSTFNTSGQEVISEIIL